MRGRISDDYKVLFVYNNIQRFDKVTRLSLVYVSSPVPFADANLIRFNGSRINGLSLMALRQVKSVYKSGLVKPSRADLIC